MEVTAQEILNFSPPNKARDAWLERAAGQRGDHLRQIERRIIERSAEEPSNLRPQLQGTGLLAWEALRRTQKGAFGCIRQTKLPPLLTGKWPLTCPM